MFWEIFIKLCNEQKKSPSKVCIELGFSTAIPTKWKEGAIPRSTSLQKIANYFNVSTDYLLGKTEQRNSTISVEQETTSPSGNDEELNELLEELRTRPEMKMLFSLAKGATKEDVEKAVAIIEALRKTSK